MKHPQLDKLMDNYTDSDMSVEDCAAQVIADLLEAVEDACNRYGYPPSTINVEGVPEEGLDVYESRKEREKSAA